MEQPCVTLWSFERTRVALVMFTLLIKTGIVDGSEMLLINRLEPHLAGLLN